VLSCKAAKEYLTAIESLEGESVRFSEGSNKRNFRLFGICVALLLLSGCESLEKISVIPLPSKPCAPTKAIEQAYLCLNSESEELFDAFCHLDTWSDYLLNAESLTLSERQTAINELGDTPQEHLQKVLLSQAVDTPYRQRLRAQNWLNDLKPMMDEKMTQVAGVLIEQPSQHMLELESTVSILTKMNAGRERSIEELQDIIGYFSTQLQKQREQVEQLLDVESTMSDQNKE